MNWYTTKDVNTKYIFPVALVVVFLILGGVYFIQSKTPEIVAVVVTPETATTTQPSTVSTTPSGYTSAEVAAHATRTSCWTSINGNVYDVAAWISKHPGGVDAILSLCGKDGTAAFSGQHGGQKRPETELAGFKIGVLTK